MSPRSFWWSRLWMTTSLPPIPHQNVCSPSLYPEPLPTLHITPAPQQARQKPSAHLAPSVLSKRKKKSVSEDKDLPLQSCLKAFQSWRKSITLYLEGCYDWQLWKWERARATLRSWGGGTVPKYSYLLGFFFLAERVSLQLFKIIKVILRYIAAQELPDHG